MRHQKSSPKGNCAVSSKWSRTYLSLLCSFRKCTPVADSCWCMAKPTQYCKVISLQLNKFILNKNKNKKRKKAYLTNALGIQGCCGLLDLKALESQIQMKEASGFKLLSSSLFKSMWLSWLKTNEPPSNKMDREEMTSLVMSDTAFKSGPFKAWLTLRKTLLISFWQASFYDTARAQRGRE